jgi:hypothetical protein
MSLIDQAKADTRQITSNSNEFARSCVFVAPTGETATVNAIVNQHHTAYNEMNERINAKISSIAVSESLLTDAGYPTRNADGDVYFRLHRVTADGQDYVCREWFTDDTVGLIVLILGEWVG